MQGIWLDLSRAYPHQRKCWFLWCATPEGDGQWNCCGYRLLWNWGRHHSSSEKKKKQQPLGSSREMKSKLSCGKEKSCTLNPTKQKEFWNTKPEVFVSSTRIELNNRAKFAEPGSTKESTRQLQEKMKAAWYLVKQNGVVGSKRLKKSILQKKPPLTHHAPVLLLCLFQALVYIYNPPFIPLKFNPMARTKSTWIQWSGITPS